VHHLVLGARRRHARLRLGIVLEAQQHLDLRAKRFLVELDRFLAAAVEEQVGLHVHDSLLVHFGRSCRRSKMQTIAWRFRPWFSPFGLRTIGRAASRQRRDFF